MCGIAGIVDLRRGPRRRRARAAASAWPARSATAARTSSASTAIGAPASAHARLSIIDLATGQQPLSQRGRLAVDRLQRRDLQLRRAAGRARGARPPVSRPAATPRSSSTPTSSGATRRSAASTASGRSRCGTRDDRSWCSPAIRSACGRSTSASTAAGSTSPARSRRSSPPIRRSAARVRSGRPRPDLHVLDARSRRRPVFAGIEELRAGRTRVYRGRRYADSVLASPRFPRRRTASFRASLDDAVEAVRAALEQATQPAHAARRRAGRQLPLRRARQLARRGARPARQGRAVLRPSRCASRTPSTTRPSISG